MIEHVWHLRDRKLSCAGKPLVMGILNLTPDSFSDGGRFNAVDQAVARALEMEREGADIIDIGGESTRPGAEPVAVAEELRRVCPVIEKLVGTLKIPISIDTTKALVAQEALKSGAEIVNDVSGGEWDPGLWGEVVAAKAGYVLVHCQGRPATMQENPAYGDVVAEVHDYLRKRLYAAADMGIAAERIVCDVGFGFGKTSDHNMALLANLKTFAALGRPLLIGVSRKSFIKKLGGEEYLPLCTELAQVWAASQGAAIWRVHDVKTAAVAARMVGQLRPAPEE